MPAWMLPRFPPPEKTNAFIPVMNPGAGCLIPTW